MHKHCVNMNSLQHMRPGPSSGGGGIEEKHNIRRFLAGHLHPAHGRAELCGPVTCDRSVVENAILFMLEAGLDELAWLIDCAG